MKLIQGIRVRLISNEDNDMFGEGIVQGYIPTIDGIDEATGKPLDEYISVDFANGENLWLNPDDVKRSL